MFSHLLVALDGSPAAESAIAYAALLPSRVVTLLTVVPCAESSGYDWLTDIADDTHHQQRRQHAQNYLKAVSEHLKQRGRTVRMVVAEGDPAEQITHASSGANVVLMTNHGQGASSTAAYGSVVDRVVRHCEKPVLVVRGVETRGTLPSIDRIVVPLDGSSIAEEASPLAMELGSQLGVPVHLVSVVDPAWFPAGSLEHAAKHIADYLASEGERFRSHALEVTTEVRRGTPAAEIITAAGSSDLIVMTAFGAATGQRWRFGSVADKLIRFAPAPVLVIRPTASSSA